MAEAGGPLSTFLGCDKNRENPGHHDSFKTVAQFVADGVHNFDTCWSTDWGVTKEEWLEYVNACTPLCVSIHCDYISDERPDTFDGGEPYPFATDKGLNASRYGSGWVRWVDCPCTRAGCVAENDGEGENEDDSQGEDEIESWSDSEEESESESDSEGDREGWKCYATHGKCGTMYENCTKSGSPYWEIVIYTAKHVIYDQLEAMRCSVVFFDDREDGSDTVTLTGGRIDLTNSDTEDLCRMYVHTHDADLGKRLRNFSDRRWEVRDKLNKDISSDVTGGPVTMISHPHGRMKYVTVGEYKGKGGVWCIKYSARSCPGSSGGLVICGARRWCGVRPISHSGAVSADIGVSVNW